MIWSGEVVGHAKQYAYVPFDLYTYRMRGTSLIHSMDWNIQQQYFAIFQRYMDLARQLTPSTATEVELEVFQAFIERENSLFTYGVINRSIEKEISQASKACRMTTKKIRESSFNIRRKLIFSYVCCRFL